MPDGELIVREWCEAVRNVYRLAHTEKMARMKDTSPSPYDERGIHSFSEEVGRVYALQALFPELRACEFDPRHIRNAARKDALAAFRVELWTEMSDGQAKST